MGGMHLKRGGYVTPSKIFIESLFAERGIGWITRAHVSDVGPGVARYETIDGPEREVAFDFAMLLPPFAGVGLTAFNRLGEDMTPRLFRPNGFMTVDAEYAPRPYDAWRAADWPRLPIAGLPQPVRRRDRVRAPARHFSPVSGTVRSPRRSCTSSHRHALGHDRQSGRAQCRRHAGRIARTHALVLDGDDGGGLRGVRRSQSLPRHRRIVDGVSHRSGLRALSRVWARPLARPPARLGSPATGSEILLHHAFLYKAQLKPGWSLIPE